MGVGAGEVGPGISAAAGGGGGGGLTTVYQDLGASNVTLSASADTQIFNPSLTVGTWLVCAVLAWSGGAASTRINAYVGGGTATYTTPANPNALGSSAKASSTATNDAGMVSFIALVTVTANGTVLIQASCSSVTGTPVILAQSTSAGGQLAQVSSVTCVKIV